MLRDEGGLAWIFRDDNWQDCADTLAAADYPEEFALSTYLDANAVEAACLAGFMPMSARFTVPRDFPYGEPESTGQASGGQASGGQDGQTRIFYTPKLHWERSILDPAKARIRSTTRRASRHFMVSINRAFEETLTACIGTHGDGWLTPALTRVFSGLHADQADRPVRFLSVELWQDQALVAGELGYAAGRAYASLSGFHRVSGAGTVQLAALAGILVESGYSVWDLGMPMGYKSDLGCHSLARHEYLPLLRAAYQHEPDKNLEIHFEPAPVRLPFTCTRSGCS
jgi:Leu/Phe-tRNA-protein transferase